MNNQQNINENQVQSTKLQVIESQETVIVNIKPKNKEINIQNDQQVKLENEDTFIQIKYPIEEPLTHRKNKKFLEKLLSCLYKNDLKQEEINAFCQLKFSCSIKFDSDKESHNDYLRKLWFILKKETLTEINNDQWKYYGFQNHNPRTDFRGGGLMSLKNLLYFSSNYDKYIDELCKEQYEFMLGVSSINITFFLMKFLHLADFLDYDKDNDEICERKTLKQFCQILKNDEDLFNKLHSLFLLQLFEAWKERKLKIPETTILNFGEVQKELYKNIKNKLEDNTYSSFKEIQNLFKKKN